MTAYALETFLGLGLTIGGTVGFIVGLTVAASQPAARRRDLEDEETGR